MFIYTHMKYVCMRLYVGTHRCVYTYIHTDISIYTHIFIDTSIYMYVITRVYVYIYIYIYYIIHIHKVHTHTYFKMYLHVCFCITEQLKFAVLRVDAALALPSHLWPRPHREAAPGSVLRDSGLPGIQCSARASPKEPGHCWTLESGRDSPEQAPSSLYWSLIVPISLGRLPCLGCRSLYD